MSDSQFTTEEIEDIQQSGEVANLPFSADIIQGFFIRLNEEPINGRLEALQLGKDVCSMFPEPLPNHIWYTACHLFNQFFVTNGLKDYPLEEIILTCIHISLKVWEIEIEIETLCHPWAPNKLINWDIEVLNLVNIEFCVNTGDLDLCEKVQSALGYFELTSSSDEDLIIEFYEKTIVSLNDIYLTPMPGIYPGHYLSAAAFYLTAIRSPVPMTDNWLKHFGLNNSDLFHVYQIIYHTVSRLKALETVSSNNGSSKPEISKV
ncbi:hypothetical protein CONCODRAFT_19715 [Conidiobolus coronatus NRRL 28638]|uniref:Cyclin N-terminal domain-containing protein n=1 Tax=Conidiobolus coronatus (strain ATCC 28846 / CBS 209.66 / NRRL 28638) TaxID=796925 RepID=A0A137NWT5_CONC2|nr:hypothetical protein CONCODRAFT_19715 [Conidiobolus coronatus NRRL 28638]|eukprot:KXN67283.1 hypothetical protein CONCODRAFT_19715 [Conidiobolus coronatus NRRL 28638]